MSIADMSIESYHMALAALGEGWEYAQTNPANDPKDPEGLTSFDDRYFDRVIQAARRNDIRTLKMLSMN